MIEFHFPLPKGFGRVGFGYDFIRDSGGFVLQKGPDERGEAIRYGDFFPRWPPEEPTRSLPARLSRHAPPQIDRDNIVHLLRRSHVAIWTGAGISESAGVLNDHQLQKRLLLRSPRQLNYLARRSPRELFERYRDFARSLFLSRPTNAHCKIAEWHAAGTDRQVWTTNVDQLHEKTGILPTRQITDLDTKAVEIVIALGVRLDLNSVHRRLGRQGVRLFSVCLNRPTFPCDGWYAGDLRHVIGDL